MTDNRRTILMDHRDHLLRQARALQNKVDGLDIAIRIVAEENGFTLVTGDQNPKGEKPQPVKVTVARP